MFLPILHMVGGVYITCQAAHLVRGELELEHRLPTFNTPSTIPKYNIHTNTYKTILLCLTYIHFQNCGLLGLNYT